MSERLFELGIERVFPWVWEDTVARCLDRNPTKRPQSAAEIWQLLQRKDEEPRKAPVAEPIVAVPPAPEAEPEVEVVEPQPSVSDMDESVPTTESVPARRGLVVPLAALLIILALGGIAAWKFGFGKASVADAKNLETGPAKGEHSVGRLDTRFDPKGGTDEEIRCVAIQEDGRILIGGSFNTYNDVPHRGLARLNADGTLDQSFTALVNGTVHAIHICPNKQILIGGDFGAITGVGSKSVALLNPDGTVDRQFQPGRGGDHEVRSILRLNDGQVLVGGHFTKFDRRNRSRIVRLHSDGAVDEGFDPNFNNVVWAMTPAPDGKIFVGGNFTRNRIACLNSAGDIDESFHPAGGANDVVYALATQADGKLLVGGKFSKMNNIGRNCLARLNSDGTIDSAFAPVIDDGSVQTVALQGDKILIGGMFTSIGGLTRKYVARLNADGSVDRDFDSEKGPNFVVRALAVDKDQNIIVVGGFGFVDGVPRARIARLYGR
jgi:uncharacterized delta-60 repeat protein